MFAQSDTSADLGQPLLRPPALQLCGSGYSSISNGSSTGSSATGACVGPIRAIHLVPALRAVQAAAKKAGLEGIGLHSLRHSAASVMLSGGVPLKVVSDVLGHASIAITADVYGHVSPEVSREALDSLSKALGA